MGGTWRNIKNMQNNMADIKNMLEVFFFWNDENLNIAEVVPSGVLEYIGGLYVFSRTQNKKVSIFTKIQNFGIFGISWNY